MAMRHIHLTLAATGALLLGQMALSGCSDRAGAVRAKDTLVFATDREPACLDPNLVGNMPQIFLARQYLDSVVAMDEKGHILPWLAKRWTISPDGKVYTFYLREDVKFTNGEAFDAQALKKNLDHIVDPATHAMTATFLVDYDRTETPAPFVAEVHLKNANSSFLPLMAEGILGMEAPASFARTREENCAAPIGSGPFKIARWDRQQQVVLERNPDYNWAPPNAWHQGPAHVRQVIWKFIPEPSVRFASLQAGQVDVIDSVLPEYEEKGEGDPNLRFLAADRPGTPTNGSFNTRRVPFNDIRVREAFIRSADVEAGIKSIFFGRYRRSDGPLSPTTPYHVSDFAKADRYDPAQANALLDAAGWTGRTTDGIRTKGGRALIVHVPVRSSLDSAERALWEQIQATTRLAGFDVRLENASDNRELELNQRLEYDIRLAYWNGNNPDILRLQFGSPAVGPKPTSLFHPNVTGFDNRRFDQLIALGRETADEDKRAAIYRAAQEIIAYNYLQLRTYPQATRLGIRRTVKGVHFDPALNLCTLYDAEIIQ